MNSSCNITNLTPSSCPAYILAGGRSSRFPGDKALARILGKPQLIRLTELLVTQGHQVQVIADRSERYQKLQIKCLVDVSENSGPIAGLATALAHREHLNGPGWLLLINCDQLRWDSAWLAHLSSQASDNVDAICFTDGEHAIPLKNTGKSTAFHPLPGLFHTRLLRPVRNAITCRELALQSILSQARTIAVNSTDQPQKWSFNTQCELEKIMERI